MRNQAVKLASPDQFVKRTANRSAILREIHFTGPMQRVELSRRLKIRKSSVTSIAAELVRRGVIAEETPDSVRSKLSLSDGGRCVLAAQLAIGRIYVSRVMLNGTIAGITPVPFELTASADEILQTLGDALERELNRSRSNVMGVGLAMLGGMEPSTGVTTFSANLRQWRNVPVRQYLEERLKVGVLVDNDIRCQLWNVAWFDRHLRDSSNMLYVGLMETGVAGALIMRGRMIYGRSLCAGDFGHVHAGDDGRLCSCGKIDCLETYTSMPSILREVINVRPDQSRITSANEVAQLAGEDRVVMNTLDRIVARLATILTPILAALDPDGLVIGTPAPALSQILCDLLDRRLQMELMGIGSQGIKPIPGGAGADSTLRGIAGLVLDRCFRSGSLELTPQYGRPVDAAVPV